MTVAEPLGSLSPNHFTFVDSELGAEQHAGAICHVLGRSEFARRMTDAAKLAVGSAARGAAPLNYNNFKFPLLENLVMRAIRDA